MKRKNIHVFFYLLILSFILYNKIINVLNFPINNGINKKDDSKIKRGKDEDSNSNSSSSSISTAVFYLSDERIYINEQHFTNIKLLQNILTEHIKSNEHKKELEELGLLNIKSLLYEDFKQEIYNSMKLIFQFIKQNFYYLCKYINEEKKRNKLSANNYLSDDQIYSVIQNKIINTNVDKNKKFGDLLNYIIKLKKIFNISFSMNLEKEIRPIILITHVNPANNSVHININNNMTEESIDEMKKNGSLKKDKYVEEISESILNPIKTNSLFVKISNSLKWPLHFYRNLCYKNNYKVASENWVSYFYDHNETLCHVETFGTGDCLFLSLQYLLQNNGIKKNNFVENKNVKESKFISWYIEKVKQSNKVNYDVTDLRYITTFYVIKYFPGFSSDNDIDENNINDKLDLLINLELTNYYLEKDLMYEVIKNKGPIVNQQENVKETIQEDKNVEEGDKIKNDDKNVTPCVDDERGLLTNKCNTTGKNNNNNNNNNNNKNNDNNKNKNNDNNKNKNNDNQIDDDLTGPYNNHINQHNNKVEEKHLVHFNDDQNHINNLNKEAEGSTEHSNSNHDYSSEKENAYNPNGSFSSFSSFSSDEDTSYASKKPNSLSCSENTENTKMDSSLLTKGDNHNEYNDDDINKDKENILNSDENFNHENDLYSNKEITIYKVNNHEVSKSSKNNRRYKSEPHYRIVYKNNKSSNTTNNYISPHFMNEENMDENNKNVTFSNNDNNNNNGDKKQKSINNFNNVDEKKESYDNDVSSSKSMSEGTKKKTTKQQGIINYYEKRRCINNNSRSKSLSCKGDKLSSNEKHAYNRFENNSINMNVKNKYKDDNNDNNKNYSNDTIYGNEKQKSGTTSKSIFQKIKSMCYDNHDDTDDYAEILDEVQDLGYRLYELIFIKLVSLSKNKLKLNELMKLSKNDLKKLQGTDHKVRVIASNMFSKKLSEGTVLPFYTFLNIKNKLNNPFSNMDFSNKDYYIVVMKTTFNKDIKRKKDGLVTRSLILNHRGDSISYWSIKNNDFHFTSDNKVIQTKTIKEKASAFFYERTRLGHVHWGDETDYDAFQKMFNIGLITFMNNNTKLFFPKGTFKEYPMHFLIYYYSGIHFEPGVHVTLNGKTETCHSSYKTGDIPNSFMEIPEK
ncbi:conserved Plasmodium protein, unknown function [Plasmodium sp. gorilla clade G1]|nr:conserved Plasmodium protein, unknown function [Plasmodium sp. gorilla clade G1]